MPLRPGWEAGLGNSDEGRVRSPTPRVLLLPSDYLGWEGVEVG